MSKYWHIEDGQVCWRTPYADLRGCDYTMLVACLNERDEKIADLKKQLSDVKNYCDYYMKRSNNLVLKLAESERQHQEYRQIVEKDIKKEVDERIRDTIKEFNFDISQLKLQLEEKDLRIEELESQFDYECECNKQFVDSQNENTQLKQQLAEKEKTIEEINKEFVQAVKDWKSLVEKKNKDIVELEEHDNLYHNQLAIEQLEKVKKYADIDFRENCYIDAVGLDKFIENQIKELKGD